jgi:hypothetical protein
LQSKYTECRKTYITEAHTHGQAHKFFRRLRDLLKSKNRDDALIETLDTLLGECCTIGEKRSTKTRAAWWTHEINRLRLRRRILQKLRSAFMNKKNFDVQIQRDCEDAGLNTPLPTTLEATILELTAIRKEIKTCAANSDSTCIQESVDQAIIERKLGHHDKAKIIDNIRKAESKNATYRMFKTIRGKNNTCNLTTVHIPKSWPPSDQLDNPAIHLADPKVWDKDDKPFRTLTLPDEITKYLTARNQRHFGQATGTPFTVAPLAELITWTADTDTAELILQSAYSNNEIDDITQLLLKHCKSVSTPDVIKPELSLNDFTAKLRAWRESHYKAVFRPIAYACEHRDKDSMEDTC